MRTLRMLELITAGVEKRLWVTDAYFLSLPILTQSLLSTARDGVDVRVLVPATNNIRWIGAASRTGYRQFLEAGVRIFEYGGPMIHAKTVVADGWWSKVGSTNLNFSSLFANWEIDLVAEDAGFASEMERLFEEDLSAASEVHLVKTGRHQHVRPERPVDTSNRGARQGVVGGGSGSSATIARVGSTAACRRAGRRYARTSTPWRGGERRAAWDLAGRAAFPAEPLVAVGGCRRRHSAASAWYVPRTLVALLRMRPSRPEVDAALAVPDLDERNLREPPPAGLGGSLPQQNGARRDEGHESRHRDRERWTSWTAKSLTAVGANRHCSLTSCARPCACGRFRTGLTAEQTRRPRTCGRCSRPT